MKRNSTTRQLKTRSTTIGEVVYPWHPWFGRRVVCQAAAKFEAVFRCASPDASSARQLEVPPVDV